MFIPVILKCEGEENAKRMGSVERVEVVRKYGKGMLLDTETLRKLRTRVDVFRFGGREELVLDVTRLSAEMAAGEIQKHVLKVAAER